MPIDTITSREHFQSLRPNWDRVYAADHEAQIFLSWHWLWDLYERRSEDVLILAYREDSPATEKLINSNEIDYWAFMPVRKQLRLAKDEERFLVSYSLTGNYWADYTGLLCNDQHQLTAIPALGEYLATLSWSRLYLDCLNMSGTRLKLLINAFENPLYTVTQRKRRHKEPGDTSIELNLLRSPRIALPETYGSYLQNQVSANTRQRIRRFTRKLNDNQDLSIRLSTPETLDADLRSFMELWKKRWKEDKGDQVDSKARRYALIIRQALAADYMRLSVMDYNEKPVGMAACYIDNPTKTVLFFVGARKLSFNLVPSGLLLHTTMIQWAIDHGFRYYDLLIGNEPYKYSFGAQDQKLKSLLISVNEDINISRLDKDDFLLEQALIAVREYQRTAPWSVVEKLYKQLQDNWPQEDRLSKQFDKWLLGHPHNSR